MPGRIHMVSNFMRTPQSLLLHNRQLGKFLMSNSQAYPDVCVHNCCGTAAHPRNVEQLESPYYQCVGVRQQWLEGSRQMD